MWHQYWNRKRWGQCCGDRTRARILPSVVWWESSEVPARYAMSKLELSAHWRLPYNFYIPRRRNAQHLQQGEVCTICIYMWSTGKIKRSWFRGSNIIASTRNNFYFGVYLLKHFRMLQPAKRIHSNLDHGVKIVESAYVNALWMTTATFYILLTRSHFLEYQSEFQLSSWEFHIIHSSYDHDVVHDGTKHTK